MKAIVIKRLMTSLITAIAKQREAEIFKTIDKFMYENEINPIELAWIHNIIVVGIRRVKEDVYDMAISEAIRKRIVQYLKDFLSSSNENRAMSLQEAVDAINDNTVQMVETGRQGLLNSFSIIEMPKEITTREWKRGR